MPPPNTDATEPTLKIGEVARQAALSIDAVRFYEREGLLGRVPRSPAGQRRYAQDAVRRLAFVRRATALGFSLAEVKSLLAIRVSPRMSCARGRDRALEKLAEIDRRIAALEAMRDALLRLAGKCESGRVTGTCAFLDELEDPLEPGAARAHRAGRSAARGAAELSGGPRARRASPAQDGSRGSHA